MRVQAIVTAWLEIPSLYVFRTRGPALRAPCLAFVVRHPWAGPIVVDTGLHLDAIRSLRADFGPAMGLFFRSLRPAGEPFDAQLRAVGVDPEAVERVVMTHLHVDHTSAMRLLPRAEFTCSRAEWDAATAGARLPELQGYVRRHLPPASRMRLVDIGAEGAPHGPFGATLDLLGDGSLRLVATPGHTRGHVSLLIDDAGGRPILLAGDAAYTRRSIERQALPLRSVDAGAARRSLIELQAFARARPDAAIVPSHDPDAWRELT